MDEQKLSEAEQEELLRRFDSFSKKVIRTEVDCQMARWYKKLEKRKKEFPYEGCPDLLDLAYTDSYESEKSRIRMGQREYLFENEDLYEAVNGLCDSLKKVLLLTYFDERSAEETAEELAIQIGTVYRYRSNALKYLKEKLCEK